MAAVAERLRARIRDAAVTSPDSETFRQEVLDVINAVVPFDATCLAGADPYVRVPTSLTTRGYDDLRAYAVAAEIEYSETAEATFDSMIRDRTPIRTLAAATDGQSRRTRRYAELLAPYGLVHELRMLIPGRDGLTWGLATLSRGGSRPFGAADEKVLGAVLTDIGDGMRSMLFRDSVIARIEPGIGPAIAVLGPDNEFESATPEALIQLERFSWGPTGLPIALAPAAFAAARLRASGQDSIVLRTRTVDGEWLVLRAGRYDTEHPPRRVVMTIERAQPPEIVSLMAAAFGLTRRECQVLLLSLRGASNEEMARRLFISPYTVKDHLKSIFAKTGVRSRPGLLGLIVNTECLPRIAAGVPVGPSGWFDDAPSCDVAR